MDVAVVTGERRLVERLPCILDLSTDEILVFDARSLQVDLPFLRGDVLALVK